ncbi:MAG: hypothetical protein LBD72_01955 [Puniceicoccales bacterium]|nr:hypothetical protein [Puniceicoccales bacterium]
MSKINQFVLRFLGVPLRNGGDGRTCQVRCGGTNTICLNASYNALQNVAGMVLRWIIHATGVGAIVLWLFNRIYENSESDAQSPTQAIIKACLACTTANKEKNSQKRAKNIQAANRMGSKWGFSIREPAGNPAPA